MEAFFVPLLVVLFGIFVCAVAVAVKVWEVGTRLIEWIEGWEPVDVEVDPEPGDDVFPGDEWKHGNQGDEE